MVRLNIYVVFSREYCEGDLKKEQPIIRQQPINLIWYDRINDLIPGHLLLKHDDLVCKGRSWHEMLRNLNYFVRVQYAVLTSPSKDEIHTYATQISW